MDALPENPLKSPDLSPPPAHPARLIFTLSLAPTVGLGIGRFAYSLVLPDMRKALGAIAAAFQPRLTPKS